MKAIEDNLLALLRMQSDTLAAFVTEKYLQTHPEYNDEDIQRIRKMCHEDLSHHLEFICSALSLGKMQVFTDYAAWLKNVLESRQLPVMHAIDAFKLIQVFAREQIDSVVHDPLNEVLEAGIEILTQADTHVPLPLASSTTLPKTTQYTKAIVDGDGKQASQIVDEYLDEGTSLVDLSVSMLQPAMYEIGQLWQTNQISVAHEHMATAITQNLMARAYTRSEFAEPIDRRAVFTCIEGNHHSLGLRMVSDAYEVKGWDVEFLGSDTPTDSLLVFLDNQRPDLLAMSLSMPDQVIKLQQVLDMLNSELGSDMPAVVIGGLAINALGGVPSRCRVDNWFTDAKCAVEELQ